jgi:hypothetical protein
LRNQLIESLFESLELFFHSPGDTPFSDEAAMIRCVSVIDIFTKFVISSTVY